MTLRPTEEQELVALLEQEREANLNCRIFSEMCDATGQYMKPEEREVALNKHVAMIEWRKCNQTAGMEGLKSKEPEVHLKPWYSQEVIKLHKQACAFLTSAAAYEGRPCPTVHDFMALWPYPGAADAHKIRGGLPPSRRQTWELYHSFIQWPGFAALHDEIVLSTAVCGASQFVEYRDRVSGWVDEMKAEMAAVHVEAGAGSCRGWRN